MARVYQSGAHRSVETVAKVPVTLEEGRVSWGGVWSGFLFGMGVLLLLSTLGLAIGVSAADIGPQRDLNSSGLGIGAAVWSGASLLIALFVGGLVATRVGMVFDRTAGMIQGALVWVLVCVVGRGFWGSLSFLFWGLCGGGAGGSGGLFLLFFK